jgi:putative peptide zinc metalloprotease protein
MSSIYEVLARKTARPSGEEGLWQRLAERLNPANYRPRRDPRTESFAVTDPHRPPYVVLRHPEALTYLRLNEEEQFLWDQMDGSRAVKDLVIAYFTRFGSLAFGRVGGLVFHLHQRWFLTDKPRNLFAAVSRRLAARRPLLLWQRAVGYLLGRPLIVRGIDPWIDRFYRRGGRILYSRPLLVLYAVVAVAGGALFFEQAASGRFSVVGSGSSAARGVGAFFLLNYVAIFIHEMAHALTCRHYGARVNGGGFLLFFGIPAFFIDTTDIWTRPRRARMATSWAGPYSGLILAGAISLAIAAFPQLPLAAELHRLAFIWVIVLIFNLIPFVELDGYYLLVDWLNVPRLRPRALAFVLRDFWRKLARGEPFSAIERLFTWFGIGSVVVTAALIVLGLTFWQLKLGAVLAELWAAGGGRRVLAVVAVLVLVVPLLTTLAAGLYGSARDALRLVRSWWARPRRATVRDRLALLNRVAFLTPLPQDARLQIAQRLAPVRVRAGDAVFRQGDRGDAFYLIQRGQADVVAVRNGEGRVLTRLDAGEYFGEIALLGKATRTATVRAVTPLQLLALRKGDFERLLAPHVAASERVEEAIRESENLRELPLLAALSPAELDAVGKRLRRRQFPAGGTVVQQGEVGTEFYIIHSGQAEVLQESADGPARVRLLGPGDYFGEIALLMDEPRSATVRALTPLEVHSLDREAFETLLGGLLPVIAAEAETRVERDRVADPRA